MWVKNGQHNASQPLHLIDGEFSVIADIEVKRLP